MKTDDIAAGLFIIVGAVAILAGIGVGVLQCYWYLQSGHWTPLSIVEAVWLMRGQSISNDWWNMPTEWIGLHKIMLQIPFGLALFVAGLVISSIGANS